MKRAGNRKRLGKIEATHHSSYIKCKLGNVMTIILFDALCFSAIDR